MHRTSTRFHLPYIHVILAITRASLTLQKENPTFFTVIHLNSIATLTIFKAILCESLSHFDKACICPIRGNPRVTHLSSAQHMYRLLARGRLKAHLIKTQIPVHKKSPAYQRGFFCFPVMQIKG